MKKSRKPEKFIKTPGYPGGREALGAFIKLNLVYPEEAIKARVEGKVVISFVIDGTGKVTNAEVVNGIGYGCDEEALRLVKMLKFEPVKQRGFKATFQKTVTIQFKLPGSAMADAQLKYNVVKEKKPVAEVKPGKVTYSYSIKLEIPKKKI